MKTRATDMMDKIIKERLINLYLCIGRKYLGKKEKIMDLKIKWKGTVREIGENLERVLI